MKEGLPKRETKSKNSSRHTEWEAKDIGIIIPLYTIFLFGALFGDLF